MRNNANWYGWEDSSIVDLLNSKGLVFEAVFDYAYDGTYRTIFDVKDGSTSYHVNAEDGYIELEFPSVGVQAIKPNGMVDAYVSLRDNGHDFVIGTHFVNDHSSAGVAATELSGAIGIYVAAKSTSQGNNRGCIHRFEIYESTGTQEGDLAGKFRFPALAFITSGVDVTIESVSFELFACIHVDFGLLVVGDDGVRRVRIGEFRQEQVTSDYLFRYDSMTRVVTFFIGKGLRLRRDQNLLLEVRDRIFTDVDAFRRSSSVVANFTITWGSARGYL
jgi:hypothetical protein